MAKDYISRCVKYVLFSLNILFLAAGLGLIAFGIYAELQKQTSIESVLDFFLNPSILLLIIGSVLVFTTMLGCLGALRENTTLLKVYKYILIFLLIIEVLVVAAFLMYFFVPQVRSYISFLDPAPLLRKAILKYRDDPDLKDTIDQMQSKLECCGASDDDEGYKDWDLNPYFNCSISAARIEKCGVPASCCSMDKENLACGNNVRNSDMVSAADLPTMIYTRGCVKAIGALLQENVIIVGAVLLGIFIPQIVCLRLVGTLIEQIETQIGMWDRR